MATAIVLGGNGLVGVAAARRLAEAGWDVTCSGRSQARFPDHLRDAGVRFVTSDRYDVEALGRLLEGGGDVVVDCLCYTAEHARMLLRHQEDLGSVVFISSKAVYVDDHGRHVNSSQPPRFTGPVTEAQPTMAPSDIDHHSPAGYGANKVAAEQVLLTSQIPVTVVRASRVHGVEGARPLEWVFVKRVLDQRRHVLLAHHGRGVNHPTAAVNLAALIEFCAARPGTRILNSADPDAPDGRTIAQTIAAHLGHTWHEVLLDENAPADLGDHPWNSIPPFVLDTTAARQLGFAAVGTYAQTVTPLLDRLVASSRAGDPDQVLPTPDDTYFRDYFDYDREDAWLAAARPNPPTS